MGSHMPRLLPTSLGFTSCHKNMEQIQKKKTCIACKCNMDVFLYRLQTCEKGTFTRLKSGEITAGRDKMSKAGKKTESKKKEKSNQQSKKERGRAAQHAAVQLCACRERCRSAQVCGGG